MRRSSSLYASISLVIVLAVGAAAPMALAETSVTEPGMPWPVSNAPANWHATSDSDTAPVDEAANVTEPGMPWPVSMEPANWNITISNSNEAPEVATIVTEPGIPWPISSEPANWHIPIAAPVEAPAQEPALAAASVTVPAIEWPVSKVPANWQSMAPPVAAVATCHDELRSAVREGTIQFQTSSATLARASFATLDRIAAIAKGCADVKITVEGHTDAAGQPERNKKLSQRRADGIAAYLARAGVSKSSLTAIGHGQEKPIATNDTEDGRAKNRRIEFIVN